MIRHADGEYGFYAHLLKDSLTVKVGDKVKLGQVIGVCGFSGNGTEPHLHFHLQDRPDFYQGMGLPIKFDQVTVDGQLGTGPVAVVRGTRVANLISQACAPS
jgi:murein DD-endopeptidase MepM/ murein hydrolase activator NlpD